ncbi:MAG: hypothetical protein ABI488_16165 [Polyangiaceae bacterium]
MNRKGRSITPAERWAAFQPPRLPEADRLDAAIARLSHMTPEQLFQTSVHAGVHQADGTLTEDYRDKKR